MPSSEILILDAPAVAMLLPQINIELPLRDALVAIAQERVSVPPRQSALAPAGRLTAMPNFVSGYGLSCKLMAVYPEQAPYSHSGAVALFDEYTGQLQALVDASLLTAVRTAVVTAIVVDTLARTDARNLTIIGDGVQGRSHLQQLQSVRAWASVSVVARTERRRAELEQIDPRVRLLYDAEAPVRDADVVVSCTSSPTPVIREEWISAGTLVASVGGGHELEPVTVNSRPVYVEWPGAALYPSPAGAFELQDHPEDQIRLIGDVLEGEIAGRENEADVLIYKATGLGVEDTVVVNALVEAARRGGNGVWVPWMRGH